MDSLKELYHFQEISNRITQLGEQQATLDADASFSAAKDRMTHLSLELASIEKAVTSLQKEIKQLEALNTEAKDKRRQCEKKLYDGSTASPKELAQLQQKIDEYQEQMDLNDDKMLQLWEELDKKEQKAVLAQKEQKQLNADLTVIKQNHQQRNNEYEVEIARLEEEAREVKKLLSEELLQLYAKVARAHHGVAIAPLKGDACGACHVALSSGILHTLRKSKEGYIRCENCGRMIFIL